MSTAIDSFMRSPPPTCFEFRQAAIMIFPSPSRDFPCWTSNGIRRFTVASRVRRVCSFSTSLAFLSTRSLAARPADSRSRLAHIDAWT